MLPRLLFGLTTVAALLLPPPVRQGTAVAGAAATRRSVLLGAGAAAVALTTSPHSAVAALSTVFNPPSGSLAGQTILITGANTGLGLESAKRLHGAGANVIVAARSQAKADGAAEAVKADSPQSPGSVIGVMVDLADLKSVSSLSGRLSAAMGSEAPVIDVLLNNAGVMAIPERLTTSDGFEKTIGINHLGHFALVAALLPSLKRAKNGFRVINVSSDAHRFASRDAVVEMLDSNLDPSYSAWGNYGLSKAANVLFTVELQRRLDEAGIPGSTVSLHPGLVQTDLQRYVVVAWLQLTPACQRQRHRQRGSQSSSRQTSWTRW